MPIKKITTVGHLKNMLRKTKYILSTNTVNQCLEAQEVVHIFSILWVTLASIDETLGQRFLQVTWICQIGSGKDFLILLQPGWGLV